MRAIRRSDTKPELALRRALHGRGYRYRKDLRLDLDGGARVRPDIVFTARRVAVFVDGCFWHCCPEHGSKPAVNTGYWNPKLRRTWNATGPPTPRWPRRAGRSSGCGSTSRWTPPSPRSPRAGPPPAGAAPERQLGPVRRIHLSGHAGVKSGPAGRRWWHTLVSFLLH